MSWQERHCAVVYGADVTQPSIVVPGLVPGTYSATGTLTQLKGLGVEQIGLQAPYVRDCVTGDCTRHLEHTPSPRLHGSRAHHGGAMLAWAAPG